MARRWKAGGRWKEAGEEKKERDLTNDVERWKYRRR
jgi:hypothetical protein